MSLPPTKINVIGAGNMAQAIFLGATSKTFNHSLFFYTPSYQSALQLANQTNGTAVKSIADFDPEGIFLLAHKPQQLPDVADKLVSLIHPNSQIISILAGVSYENLLKAFCNKTKHILRTMPSTPSQVKEGITLFFGDNAPKKIAEEIFSPISQICTLKTQEQFDKLTTITGSGPAYIFELLRIFSKQVEKITNDPDLSKSLVLQLFSGSISLAQQNPEDFEQLRNNVTSKKGVTAEALKVFEEEGLERIVEKALNQAFIRCQELDKEFSLK